MKKIVTIISQIIVIIWHIVANAQSFTDISVSLTGVLYSSENESDYSNEVSATPYGRAVWYVSTNGNDALNDGSLQFPFTTIQDALNNAQPSDTIIVLEGTYYEHIDWPQTSGLVLKGQSTPQSTIINGSDFNRSVILFPKKTTGEIRALTITGGKMGTYEQSLNLWGTGIVTDDSTTVTINNCIITSNGSFGSGGAAAIWFGRYSRGIVKASDVSSNLSDGASGIAGYSSSKVWIINTTVTNNVSSGTMTAVYANCDSMFISSSVISNNSGPNGNGFAGGLAIMGGYVSVINTIISHNSIYGISKTDGAATPFLRYCNVWGNGIQNFYSFPSGSYDDPIGTFGNISTDPIFVDISSSDFHLANTSPCIGAGTVSVEITGTWYYAPSTDIEGNQRPNPPGSNPDMGAYENSLATPIQSDNTPPSTITNFSVSAVTATSATLTWTAPGDDSSSGTATTYDIRYSTSSISETNWASAYQAQNEPTPQAAGSAETFTVSGLSGNTTYYFGIKTSDEVPNESGISNIASTTTNSLHDDPGYAINLDGSDYVHIPQDAVLQTRNSMTIEAWIRCEDPTRAQQIFDENNGYYNHIELSLRNNAGVRFAHQDTIFDTGSGLISANQWTHVAGVYDSENNTGKIYINGSLVTVTGEDVNTTGTAYDVAIGSFSSGAYPGYKFKGQIDEVRHWNVARTTTQIQNSYNHCVDKSEPNLVGYWQFDNTANDSTSNVNNGTLMGDPTYIWSTAPFGTDNTVPSSVADLNVSSVTGNAVTLSWTAPGDDENTGMVLEYDVRYSTSTITSENWDSASEATDETTPQMAGSSESFTVSGLTSNTTYYFGLKSKDNGNNWSGLSNVANGKTGTAVSGNITSNTTWALANSPYIATGDVVVRSNATLTIEAGVSVLFLNNVGLRIGYESGPYVYTGRLIAEGNSENPITFTSQSGNTNDWDGIYFSNSSDYGSSTTSTMTYCIVEKAGQSGWGKDANIYCYMTSQPTLTNSTVRNATGYGIYLYQSNITVNNCTISSNTGEGIRCEDCAPSISGSTFQNNGSYPIHFDAKYFITHSNNTFSGNGTEGIAVDGGTIGGSGGTWPFDGNEPYIVLGDITVGSYQTILTIQPGVTVKFSSGTGMRFGYDNYPVVYPGGINAIGKIDSLITFTSLSGNTNDWDGFYFSNWSDYGVSSTMSYCLVEKAGQSGWGQSANIYCNQTTTPTIDHCTITNATGVGLYTDASSITIHESEIYSNTQYGIYHSGSGSVNAEHNWWGDSSGPLDDSDDTGSGGLYNPTGTGDRVTDGIDYNPWDRKDTESVSSTGNYSFNESSEGGDGHDVNMNFSNITGSGNVTVRQTNEQPSDAPSFNAFGHYLTIEIDASITGFSADITFHYTDTDATGYTESNAFFGIAKFNSSINTWQWLGGTVNASSNTVTVSGVTSFSAFALFRRIFGDITGDGYVDAADLQRLGDCWHSTNSGEFTGGSDARFFNFNKNTDGGNQIIDAADLQVFGDCWHNGVQK